MKKIRLEFPVRWEEGSRELLPSKIWLKVVKDHTEAYKDEGFLQALPETEEKISVEVEVPDNLEVIEIDPPTPSNPADSIYIAWHGDKRIAGLEKVYVIFGNNKTYEAEIVDERPSLEAWREFTKYDPEGMMLFMKTWALVVYATETKSTGEFFFKDITRCMRMTIAKVGQ